VWNLGATLTRWIVSNRRPPPLGFGIRSGLLRRFGQVLPELEYPTWLSADFERDFDLRERWSRIWAPPAAVHPFNPKAYHAMNSGLFAGVQEICEPTWTLVPLETRNPFLDRRLTRFLLRVPVIPWALNKQLLRTAEAGILPEEIRLRPKTPVPRDPLVLHANAGTWSREIQDPPADLLRPLVDWALLAKLLGAASDTSLYVYLRPVALSRWLKAVEMPAGIQ
jgi:asparagine synthase (glutamine-hydrolysing)